MKIIDKALLKLFAGPGQCELCGRWFAHRHAHHAFIRRWCRRDVAANLASLCPSCHRRAEVGDAVKAIREQLERIVAKREGLSVEELRLRIRDLKWGPT